MWKWDNSARYKPESTDPIVEHKPVVLQQRLCWTVLSELFLSYVQYFKCNNWNCMLMTKHSTTSHWKSTTFWTFFLSPSTYLELYFTFSYYIFFLTNFWKHFEDFLMSIFLILTFVTRLFFFKKNIDHSSYKIYYTKYQSL